MTFKENCFREITLRICSSLDINVAIARTFDYLRAILPLDEIFLDILDPKLGSIRRIARHPLQHKTKPEIFPLPESLWKWIQDIQGAMLMSSLPLDNLGVEMGEITDMEGSSDLALPLRIENELVGILVLRAQGENMYDQGHAQLLAGVTEPFALALANTLAHEKVLHYRDSLIDDNRFLKQELKYCEGRQEVIGAETGLSDVMEMVRQVASLSNKVLLLGETGTGKEVIANAIHSNSPRSKAPFIKVNCGAIPETLIDSELFGHEKGAFSSAIASHKGRFERAHKGTLFLDEIGELPLQAQTRLLRVLQTNEIERVGGNKTIHVDVRIIAATHQNLERLVQEGHFREDLWFRLNVFPISIPPLRQRIEDIPTLISHFLSLKGKELGLRTLPPIAPGALQRLATYRWPGNIRELENLVERDLIKNRKGLLTLDITIPSSEVRETAYQGDTHPAPSNLNDAMTRHIKETLEAAEGKVHGPGGAAERLGINANTLRNRMNKLGITYGRKKTIKLST